MALNQSRYDVALDLSGMESEGQDAQMQYRTLGKMIAKSIPSGQTFVAMVAAENQLHRIRLVAGRFVHDVWNKSVRELRAGIAQAVHSRDRSFDRDLAQAFRAMVTSSVNRVSYLYLPANLAMAPVLNESGDGILIVPSLVEFARREPEPIADDFAEGFRVWAPGSPTVEPVNAADQTWDERVARMQESTVQPRSPTRGDVVHIFDSRFVVAKHPGAWFYSVQRHGLRAADTIAVYESDLRAMVRGASGPGTFYCDTGSGEWAARFIGYLRHQLRNPHRRPPFCRRAASPASRRDRADQREIDRTWNHTGRLVRRSTSNELIRADFLLPHVGSNGHGRDPAVGLPCSARSPQSALVLKGRDSNRLQAWILYWALLPRRPRPGRIGNPRVLKTPDCAVLDIHVLDVRQVSHIACNYDVTFVFDCASHRAVTHAKVHVFRVRAKWNEQYIHTLRCEQSREFGKLHIR